MTAYEFTRFEADYTSKVRARTYDANMLASLLIQSNPGKNLREQPEYKDAEDMFYETTQSCNRDEAIGWLSYYRANAIAYGLATGDRAWGYFYLAAHDILQGFYN